VQYRSSGVIYNDWKEIPEKDWYIEEYKRQIVGYKDEWVWTERPDTTGDIGRNSFYPIPKIVKTPIYERVVTGRMKNVKKQCDHSLDLVYNKKTIENNPKFQRAFGSRGVGKEWKQLRNRKSRAKAKHAIAQWYKGDFDRDISIEKMTDRWEYY